MENMNTIPVRSIQRLVSLIIVLWACTTSCVKHDFDQPPKVTDELDFTPNSSIAELKSRYVSGSFVDINDDLLIHAIVVADDRSGNFYKTLVIQDSTGGIELKLNRTGLYSAFPVGMKIGLKCKGLTIGDYNGLIQLGQGTYQSGNFTNIAGIEDYLIDRYVFKGPRNQNIPVKTRTINSLTAQDISTLVTLEKLEFARNEIGKTFANVIAQQSSNLILNDCNKNEIILRSSNFADFAGELVPEANGKITGILGKFRTDVQLFIRDLNDIDFSGPVCGVGPSVLNLIEIKELRSLYAGSTISCPDSSKIVGTVISDKNNSNITSKNLVLQDATGGITIRFVSTNTFSMGDEIEIDISKQELSEFQGLLQINAVENSRAKKLSTKVQTPKKLSISEILSDFENLESTLVEISDVELSKTSGTVFSGTCILTDVSGTMDLFTQSYASFANQNIPSGKVKIVGFVNQGGSGQSKQISIRNLDDVTGGGGSGEPVLINILDLRKSYTGSTTTINTKTKIKGIVISDRIQENTTLRNVHIQDLTGGIVVRFTANHSFDLGDEIEVDISNQEFTEFQGLLEINNVALNLATKTGTGAITPKLLSIAELLADFENLESTLVLIQDVNISNASASTYSGTCSIQDATGIMDLYTRPASKFSNETFPVSKVKITGIVNQGGNSMAMQVSVRSTSDVQP